MNGILLAAAARADEQGPLPLPSETGAADVAEAAALFEQALSLVEAGRLSEAREAFERAYERSPHPVVLYNLGVVTARLERFAAAQDYLQRYLLEAPEGAHRAEAKRLLGEVVEATSSTPPSTPSPRALPSLETPSVVEQVEHQPTRCPTPAAEHGVALTFAGLGLAIAGVGVGVGIWNAERNADAKRRALALDSNSPPEVVSNSEDLRQAVQYSEERATINAAFSSVRDFDVVTWAAVATGVALLGTGGFVFWADSGTGAASSEAKVSITPASFAVTTVW